MDMLNCFGVYAILHEPTGGAYIGSTTRSFSRRWAEHQRQLNNQAHCNPHLQAAWNKYGADSFTFLVLEVIDNPAAIQEREQYWMDSFACSGQQYNLLPFARSSRGRIIPTAMRAKIARSLQGQRLSSDRRRKIAETLRARHNNPEYRATYLSQHARTLEGVLIAPDGAEYANVTNLSAFCMQHGLVPSNLQKLINKTLSSHRGWSYRAPDGTIRAKGKGAPPALTVPGVICSPEGVQYEGVVNLSAFARQQGLDKGGLHALIKGKLRSYRGWNYDPDKGS